jgi:hypothetical protein
MTLAEFRRIAHAAINRGEAVYGRYYVDHNDQSVYCVSRWLNMNAIAFDEVYPRGHRDWPREYERAMQPRRYQDEMTIHFPRTTPLERWAAAHAKRAPNGSMAVAGTRETPA